MFRGCKPIISCSLLLLLAVTSRTIDASEYIRIASFNIAEFGEGDHPDTRDIDAIAKMLVEHDLDLIAIQEVGVVDQSTKQIFKLRKAMNDQLSASQTKYFARVTPQSGDERCAVIYRFPVVKEDNVWWLDDDKIPGNPRAGGKNYFRVPVAIPFSAGDFDFVLVIMHLTWGNLARRTQEVAALTDFLRDDSDPEQDWIVVGDMNRYGKYAKSASNKAFDQLLKNNWISHYRFPLLEAITDPDDMRVYRAATDAFSTTIAKSKNIYDQVIITQGSFREFDTASPAIGKDVGIIAFDMKPRFSSITDHNELKYRISDHRPIWIRFRIDLGDDD